MCEVLDAIEKKGIEQGIKQGIEQGIEQGNERRLVKTVVNFLSNYIRRGLPLDQQTLENIGEICEASEDRIREIAKDNGISLSC